MVLMIRGTNLDQPGWQLTLAGADPVPLQPISLHAAWAQVPTAVPRLGNWQSMTITNARHATAIQTQFQIQDRIVVCLGTLHQNFDRTVTASDPATPGEIIHVFLTGFQGTERQPDGQPNPTDRLIAVADPPGLGVPASIVEPLFLGLAPGLIGIQQLDLRVHAAPESSSPSLFRDINQHNCTLPPIASAPSRSRLF
jgi:uncharacterized protein (TIGR03437 family)